MATTPIASQNVVVKAIQERHPNLTSGELYVQIRELVESNVLQEAGVTVFSQPTRMGAYGITYHFSDCAQVVEIWSSLYAQDEDKPTALLRRIVKAYDDIPTFHKAFPQGLIRDILKLLSETK